MHFASLLAWVASGRFPPQGLWEPNTGTSWAHTGHDGVMVIWQQPTLPLKVRFEVWSRGIQGYQGQGCSNCVPGITTCSIMMYMINFPFSSAFVVQDHWLRGVNEFEYTRAEGKKKRQQKALVLCPGVTGVMCSLLYSSVMGRGCTLVISDLSIHVPMDTDSLYTWRSAFTYTKSLICTQHLWPPGPEMQLVFTVYISLYACIHEPLKSRPQSHCTVNFTYFTECVEVSLKTVFVHADVWMTEVCTASPCSSLSRPDSSRILFKMILDD